MSHKHKQQPQEESGGEGAPLWIISFADMISLLMAFFVMLSTFSGFGPNETAQLRRAVKAALAPNYYGGWYKFHPRAALGPQPLAAGQLEKGSEKPTLEDSHEGMLAETRPENFRARKIFLVESEKVFWAAGTTLSAHGRGFLDSMAAFAGQVPDRIVISETGPGDDPELGLLRAVTILKYLSRKGVSKDRCSIAAKGMLPEQDLASERMLEIALLDQSIYK
jgi:outer membrane protein OmpA-like peptidoglycan-associated protein